MYEKYYGFREKPFQLNPDPQFYFNSSQHQRAMSFVEYGLHQGEGFIVVTGEVGAGKTTVVRNLLSKLEHEQMVTAHIATTQLAAEEMLRLVAAAFGVRNRDVGKAALLLNLEAALASHTMEGKRCLLIVDEAQNLDLRAVEELRMLSNFQLGTHALLQTFLVGQPEFRRMLQGPGLTQLRQRVIASCHIGPLSVVEARQYVEHRLRLAGWSDRPIITSRAFVAVHEASDGVPRRINLILDRALLAGYLGALTLIDEDAIREVAAEIASETGPQPSLPALVEASAGAPQAPQPAPATAAVIEIQPGVRSLRKVEGGSGEANEGCKEGLRQLAEELRQINESLVRINQSNHTTLTLFRRVLAATKGGIDATPTR